MDRMKTSQAEGFIMNSTTDQLGRLVTSPSASNIDVIHTLADLKISSILS